MEGKPQKPLKEVSEDDTDRMQYHNRANSQNS